MKKPTATIFSSDAEKISSFLRSADEIGINLIIKMDISAFILEIQENDYSFLVLDCSGNETDCVKWLKIVKNICPRVPIIIIVNNIEKSAAGKLYSENIFFLMEVPLEATIIKEVFSAALSNSIKSNSKNYNSE